MKSLAEKPSRRQPRASNGKHRRVSEEEFLALYGGEDDRAEWVDGEVIEMSPARRDHNNTIQFISTVLQGVAERSSRGDVFIIEFLARLQTPPSLRHPDIAYVSASRAAIIQDTYIDGAPDLIVEVTEPDSMSRDFREKFWDYESAGVREYWIVNPGNQKLEAYRLERGKFVAIPERQGRVTSHVVKGFYLKPEWLWQRPLPSALKVLREMGVIKG
ncbi:MAG TPA: Uma2 family endonuclease [Planctomycetota bacterium]|nr:Uma2 family endonuclease [Planctomycetota bacterium]